MCDPEGQREQLDSLSFDVRVNSGRVRRVVEFYYMSDVAVIPRDLWLDLPEQPGNLEIYDAPLPLVVEIWSSSNGADDVDRKLGGYPQRGAGEIWRLHPFERTLGDWRRQSDGTYTETLYRSGSIEMVSLPTVTTDLNVLLG